MEDWKIAQNQKKKIPVEIKHSTFLVQLWRNMHIMGLDNFICIYGRKGTGKSLWCALNTALCLDPGFTEEENLEKQIVYDLLDFGELIVDPENKHKVLILDESGLSDSASAMKWWEKDLQALRDILQVDRIRNQTKIMIAPRFRFVAKFARDLFNFMIETKSINKQRGFCKARVMEYEVAQVTGVEYKKFIKTSSGDKIHQTRFWKPPKKYMDRYNKHSFPYKDGIMEKRIHEMRARNQEREYKELDGMDKEARVVDQESQLAQRVIEMFRKGELSGNHKRSFFNVDEVATHLGVTYPTARRVMGRARVLGKEQEVF